MHDRWQESWLIRRTVMHHLPRRKGSDLGLLTETAIETETGSLPHLKTGNGIVQGIGVEESAVLAPVLDPSLRKGKVTCCVLPGKGVYISDSFILGSSDASIWGHESVIGFSTPGDPVALKGKEETCKMKVQVIEENSSSLHTVLSLSLILSSTAWSCKTLLIEFSHNFLGNTFSNL